MPAAARTPRGTLDHTQAQPAGQEIAHRKGDAFPDSAPQINLEIQGDLRARKARGVLPEIFSKQTAAKMLKPRSRPQSGNARTSVSLRLPPDTLARWRATGPGWQTRMAEALTAVPLKGS